jgi:hypothetical protein
VRIGVDEEKRTGKDGKRGERWRAARVHRASP